MGPSALQGRAHCRAGQGTRHSRACDTCLGSAPRGKAASALQDGAGQGKSGQGAQAQLRIRTTGDECRTVLGVVANSMAELVKAFCSVVAGSSLLGCHVYMYMPLGAGWYGRVAGPRERGQDH